MKKEIKKWPGLTPQAATQALQEFGFNELQSVQKLTALKLFLRQFANVIVWILFIAAIISYNVDERINFWLINLIIGFVIVMGFLQEYKAEKAMDALKKIVQPTTTVIRGGILQTIPARDVVPGDIVSLEMGDQIPADAKLLHVNNTEVDESALTGESIPAHKQEADFIYASTQLVNGRCTAQVVNTGMKTKLGQIAEMIQEEEEQTPLQKKMDRLGKFIATIALGAALLILIIGISKGTPVANMLIVALVLAVAAVPEGLPLTMTLALSFGMYRMANKKAIVRRMTAVETLGSTTVICTDKTGTLTKNEMTVQRLFVDGETIKVTGTGYQPEGAFEIGGKKVKSVKKWSELFKALVLCNNANLVEKEDGTFAPVGDPTEVALLTLGAKAGYSKEELDETYSRAEEIFFTSSRKMMSTLHMDKGQYVLYSKGAPEVLLDHCTHEWRDGKSVKLTAKSREAILKENGILGGNALRVLAIATKTYATKAKPKKDVEEGLTFFGLVAMRDPVRPEVEAALLACETAGIDVVMITGDNEKTALSIARQLGMPIGPTPRAITGAELTEMSDEDLKKALKTVRVFARTQPEHKLRIVDALRKQGHTVAMTGDGINDAPALKKADIGIAMGIKGTDVAKGAADMILQDDNFATIVEAIKEGRRIFQNIEKFTIYLISKNMTEVILLFISILVFDFELLPLLAIHILFINMIGEEMPSVGLGLDRPYENLMELPPRKAEKSLLNTWNIFLLFSFAIIAALLLFVIFTLKDPATNITGARSLAFATLTLMVLVDVYNFRSLRTSIFKTGIRGNRFLLSSVIFIFCLLMFIVYHPWGQVVFETSALSPQDWLIATGTALLMVMYLEGFKYFRRQLEKVGKAHSTLARVR